MEDRDGKVVVTKVHTGYAAASAGIFAVDRVTEVAGTSTAGKNCDAVYRLIRGIKGSEIVLTLDSSVRLGLTSPPPAPPPPRPMNIHGVGASFHFMGGFEGSSEVNRPPSGDDSTLQFL